MLRGKSFTGQFLQIKKTPFPCWDVFVFSSKAIIVEYRHEKSEQLGSFENISVKTATCGNTTPWSRLSYIGGWGQLLWNMLTSSEFGLRWSAPRHRLLWHMPTNSLFGRCTVHFCNGCQELLCNALYTGSSPSCINPTDNALLHHSHVLTVHFTFLQHWCVPWASSNNNAHSQWFTLDIVCPMPPHPWEHKSTATTMVWTIWLESNDKTPRNI